MNTSNENVPWVEKYRASKLEDIVLDSFNKQILGNIVETAYFPNLLFYGPPGTGKTTTIINLVDAYQKKYSQRSKELMIHLNASDERGIEIIRIQISQFVNSKTLFNKGMKFVILDEVDYMTKNAQQALKYLLQNYASNVRFCLICNYISRIDEGLQNEFLRLRFNQLPSDDILNFLGNISVKENLNLSQPSLLLIQKLYRSDIRSMVNFMQSNQGCALDGIQINIIENAIWEDLYSKMKSTQYRQDDILNFLKETSLKYNIEKKNIIKDFLNYILRNKKEMVVPMFIEYIENIMHFQDCNLDIYVNYTISRLKTLLSKKEKE
jgi:replication factor C subunit 3/5